MTDLQQVAILQEEFKRAAVYLRNGDFANAKTIYTNLLTHLPEHPQILSNLAVAHEKEGASGEAITLLRRALDTDPSCVDALFNLGRIYQELGDHQRAETYYSQVLDQDGTHSAALNNSGVANALTGNQGIAKRRYDEASLQANPSPNSSFNHSLLAHREFDRESAFQLAALSVEQNPSDAYAHFNLAANFKDQHRYLDAAHSYLASLNIDRETPYAKGYLAYCLANMGFWTGLDDLLNEIKVDIANDKPVIDPFSASVLLDDPQLLRKACEIFSNDRFPSQSALWVGEEYSHDRLRVAYLSADYHEHATAYLMAEFFEEHDKSQFETYAISFGRESQGKMRQRLEAAFDHFIDVRDKTDQEVAEMLRELEIDIAIDLKGYTADARPGILSYRPCPVQAQYLGFPGTMGASYIDYIIADDVIIPESHEQYYTEKVIRLPGCYQPRDSKQKIADFVPTRAEEGLPDDAFVYCCFNNNYKITPQTFDVWMEILKDVPNSVLWLYEGNAEAPNNLRNEAQKRGVDPSRLIFAQKKPLDEHLARHKLADLFLDTLPCNAHTTARDALTAGLPVLTLVGQTFAGRVAASIGQDYSSGVIAVESIEQYRNQAVELTSGAIPKVTPQMTLPLVEHIFKNIASPQANNLSNDILDEAKRVGESVTRNKGSCVTLNKPILPKRAESNLMTNSLHQNTSILDSQAEKIHIWSSYFTTRNDPQRNFNWEADNFSIISGWYNSIRVCPENVQAKIFNDSCSDEFKNQFVNEQIGFISVEKLEWSTNDSRFLEYFRALRNIPDNEIVFLTDISDVEVINPKHFKKIRPGFLYLGKDLSSTPTIRQNGWMMNKIKSYIEEAKFYNFDQKFFDAPLYNAGIIGGYAKDLRVLLKNMLAILRKQTGFNNYNMFALNYSVFNSGDLRVDGMQDWLCSDFKKNQRGVDVLFKHK